MFKISVQPNVEQGIYKYAKYSARGRKTERDVRFGRSLSAGHITVLTASVRPGAGGEVLHAHRPAAHLQQGHGAADHTACAALHKPGERLHGRY